MDKKALIRIDIPDNIAKILLGEKEITTLKEAVKVYKLATGDLKEKAFAKADELMTTYKKAHLAYEHSEGRLKRLASVRSGELWEGPLNDTSWAFSGLI